jgi:hypothetical protein
VQKLKRNSRLKANSYRCFMTYPHLRACA